MLLSSTRLNDMPILKNSDSFGKRSKLIASGYVLSLIFALTVYTRIDPIYESSEHKNSIFATQLHDGCCPLLFPFEISIQTYAVFFEVIKGENLE